MDIEELLKEGPSLTLTPEAAPELPAEEKKAEPKVYEEEQYLTEEEKKQVDAFVEQIQLEDSTSILQYGAGTQKKMSDFSEGTLEKVRSKDLGEIGDLLNGVVVELKGFDEEEEKLIWSNCGECEEIDWNMLFDTDKKNYVGIVKFKEEE